MDNLNKLILDNDGNFLSDYQRRTLATGLNGKIEVYFGDLEKHLIRHINQADGIVGCVAWLTNFNILSALKNKDIVSIIVQKEDFLRPDLNSQHDSTWKHRLRKSYSQLRCNIERHQMPRLLNSVSVGSYPEINPIRCMGNHNSRKNPAFPRMHHKFIVFCKVIVRDEDKELIPYGVWTGSFNFTENSSNSLENALFIEDTALATVFYDEYAHIFTLSESLDWQTEWIAPEYRIGT
jgi:hypothetical protein